MWKPDVVLLGPAGAKIFLINGSLKRLYEEKDFFSNVTTWAGVSAGAAMSLLIVLGYNIDEIIDLCLDMNILDEIININLDEAKKNLGLIKNKLIEEKLKESIIKKIGYIPTLNELFLLTGLKLVIISFNIDKYRPEFLDKDTEPNLSCLDAALMSMAVPLLIQPRKYKGHVYCDGAIGSPYPVLYFDKDDNKVLGMYISSEEDLYCSDNKPSSYIYRLIQAGMRSLRNIEIKYSSENVKHIGLKTLVKDTTGLSISKETRKDMINYGYKMAEDFLKINSNPEKYKYNLDENEEIPFNI